MSCWAADPASNKLKYHYLPPEEVITIEVGKQQSEVLLKSWVGKKELGTATLLSNPGMSADSAGLQAFLRRQLPHTGWTSIALTPPNKIPTPNFSTAAAEIPKVGQLDNTQINTERTQQFSQKQWMKIREKQEAFIVATMGKLNDIASPYPGKKLLIATNQGAGFMISILSKNLLPKPDILVIINPFMTTSSENQALSTLLAKLDIPVLDIQSPDGHLASQKTITSRRILSPPNEPYRYSQQLMQLNLNHLEAWQTCLDLIEGFSHRINKAYPN
ncbi:DUF3530 family protein [Shewanella sp. VB17]|nr:DUF3530 family protein [Shewanella sp. VB17]